MAWLFVGSEATPQRAAIIYTLVEFSRRHGHFLETYLGDVLERLPVITNQDDRGRVAPVAGTQPPLPDQSPTLKPRSV